MSRLAGWFRSSAKPDNASETAPSPSESIAKEKEDLLDAMKWVELIMNDDIDGAWEKLQQGDSSFHEMGSAITVFMRSILGFEKQVMMEATARLADCEARAWSDFRKAQKHGASYGGSRIYPPGTEYEVVIAETQLMGAIIGVLHESFLEGMKSFYRLRRAFLTLDAIMVSEAKLLDRKRTLNNRSATSLGCNADGSRIAAESSSKDGQNGSDSDGLVNGKENRSAGAQTPLDQAAGLAITTTTLDANLEDLSLTDSRTPSPLRLQSKDVEWNSEIELENPVDRFIHSGANMCFGILLLILSLVPPSFSRILSVVGFRGDRPRAVKMLWRSASHPNVNGAVSGMMLLGYYNGLLGAADILPDSKDYDEDAEAVGPPIEKCERLLADMRSRYPDSRLWRVEESRMLANERKVAKAIELLQTGKESKMKQVAALNNFELSINAMVFQDWNLMRDTFIRCLEINDWSPSLYYYMAGCASLELYRDAFHAADQGEARRQKVKTEEYFRKAPTVTGKKRLMARQLPLETFLQRKVQKWESRAKALGVDLVDAIGSSPALEMCYVWNGQKRMGPKQLEKGVENLKWERCTAKRETVEEIKKEKDEMGVWAVSMASLLRGMGRLDEAKTVLQEKVLAHDRSIFKGPTKDDYVFPSAIYEMAAIAWAECCTPLEGDEKEALEYRRKKMVECEEQLNKVKVWESFVLDARIGMRAQSGLETLSWFKRKMGWA